MAEFMYYNKIATKNKNFIFTRKFEFLEAARKKKASTKLNFIIFMLLLLRKRWKGFTC